MAEGAKTLGPWDSWARSCVRASMQDLTPEGRVHDDWGDYIGWMLESFVTLKATLRSHLERAPN